MSIPQTPRVTDGGLGLVGTPTRPDTLACARIHGTVCFTGRLSNQWSVPSALAACGPWALMLYSPCFGLLLVRPRNIAQTLAACEAIWRGQRDQGNDLS